MDVGEFGRMNLAQLNFGSYKEYGDLTNRFYNRSLAGGAMLDIGVYALSVMRLFMASQPLRLSRWATPVRPVSTLRAALSAVTPSSSWVL